VGARPIVNLANVPGIKRRAPPRPEPPLVILVAAICSAPLAIYQYNTVPDVFPVPTPVYGTCMAWNARSCVTPIEVPWLLEA
jgi:hypothetical protein